MPWQSLQLEDSARADRAERVVSWFKRSAARRWLLIVIGTTSVGVGIVGIFLPLLPTTPFLLIAAACYVRSSPRLHDWLLTNRWTGKYIQNFREGRGMPLRAKVTVIALLWATLLLSAYLVPNPWVWAVLAGVAVGVPWLIL